jgi:hypothetical protein
MVNSESSLVPFNIEDTAFRNLVAAVLSEEATVYIGEHPEIFGGAPFPQALERSVRILGNLLNRLINHDPTRLIRTENGLRRQIKEALKLRDTNFPQMLDSIKEIREGRPEILRDYGLDNPLVESARNEYQSRFGKTEFPFNEKLFETVTNAREAMDAVARPFVEQLGDRFFDETKDTAAAEEQKQALVEQFMDPDHLAMLVRGVCFSVLLRQYGDQSKELADPLFVDYENLTSFVTMLKNRPQIPEAELPPLATVVLRSLHLPEESVEKFSPYFVTMMKQVIRSGENWLRSEASKFSANNEEYWGKFFSFFNNLPVAMPRPDFDFIFTASRLTEQNKNVPHLWRHAVSLDDGIAIPAEQDLLAGLAMLKNSGFDEDHYLVKRLKSALNAYKAFEGGQAYLFREIDRLEKRKLLYEENMAAATPSREMYAKQMATKAKMNKLSGEHRLFARVVNQQEKLAKALIFIRSTEKGTAVDREVFNYLYDQMLKETRQKNDLADTKSENIEGHLLRDFSWDQFPDWLKKQRVLLNKPHQLVERTESVKSMLYAVENDNLPPILEVRAEEIKRFVQEWKQIYPAEYYKRKGESQKNKRYKKWFDQLLTSDEHFQPGKKGFLLEWLKEDLTGRLKLYRQLLNWQLTKERTASYYLKIAEDYHQDVTPQAVQELRSYFRKYSPKKLTTSVLPEKYQQISKLEELEGDVEQLIELVKSYKEARKNIHSVPLSFKNKAQFLEQATTKGLVFSRRGDKESVEFIDRLTQSFDNPLIPWQEAEGLPSRDFFEALSDRAGYVEALLGIKNVEQELEKLQQQKGEIEAQVKSFEATAKLKQLKVSMKNIEETRGQSQLDLIDTMRRLDLLLEKKPS